MVSAAAAALLLANLWAFALFGIDKARARNKQRRISEATLLQVAFIGIFGAYAGRSHFRHKTRKQGFSTRLHLIAMVQFGMATGLAWAWFSQR
ncbi:DUF1294 domain-containing protein [Sphingobium boeckii]|uniref:Uncharacterized membrane protein YsdA (DUF1294 family) n=1 Tax=Sphingobium boeckii TaxID=1082345 RepID=A0A7W9AL27_9SPHN|nr:DUF1294 domain-containing protein [Sphingobium boeckii]MBB5687461.1 uncharacterized membrane protein YsdA (DUF1294 family) [Sphingobium boeckii]